MTFDNHVNLLLGTVTVAPVPAASGTSLDVSADFIARAPAAPFNCCVYPAGTVPLFTNAEIVRVTAIVGSTLTIVRAQEGTNARDIIAGDQIANTTSALVFTDIENSIIQFISAGTTKAGASEVVFSNSNGVSFGADGQTITASVAAAGGSINFSAGTTSNNVTDIVFSNSNGISFGLNGSTITGSHNALTSQSNQVASATNGSFTFQTLGFSDGNGVTFGTSAGSIISASVQTSYLTSQSNQAASASNGSFTFQTLGFSNANNVTFGTSAGSIITASVGTAAAGNSVNFSAGTTSNNLGSIVFSNSNGVSFGLNGSTITASASGGGAAAASLSFWDMYYPPDLYVNCFVTTVASRPIFAPFNMTDGSIQINSLNAFLNRNGGTSLSMTMGIAFYSFAASSQLSLYTSDSQSYSFSASSMFSGAQQQLLFTGMSNGTLTNGQWVIAMHFQGSDTGVMNMNILGGSSFQLVRTWLGGTSTAATATNVLAFPFAGQYSTSTNAFPATVGSNQVFPIGANTFRPLPYVNVIAAPLV